MDRVGEIVTFRGALYRITGRGRVRDTYDIVRHPDEMAGDRWRNVPGEQLRAETVGARPA